MNESQKDDLVADAVAIREGKREGLKEFLESYPLYRRIDQEAL